MRQDRRRSGVSRAREAVALSALAASLVASAGTAVAQTAAPSIAVRTATAPITAAQASETPITASCPGGSVLVGGGIHVFYSGPPLDPSTNPYEPINGLIVRGTTPSDAAAAPSSNGTNDPRSWTAFGGFAGQFEAVDSGTAFAMCSTADGPEHTVVVTKDVNGPLVAATTIAATATCPTGTRLVGGGARMTPATSASAKPVGSYPSDATGALAAIDDPDSWTAVGEAGGQMNAANVTTAYALCSTDPDLHTTVVRNDAIDHPAGPGNSTTPGADPIATATATCPLTTQLLSGGVLAIGSAAGDDRGNLQQGVHVRGSYPLDGAGNEVADGATAPAKWRAIVQSGGTPTPGTDTFAYALCAKAPVVGDQADLSVTISDAPDPVTAGDELTYALKVSNAGPQAATGVTLTQPLPAGVTFVSATTSAGTCGHDATAVTCAIGTLASGVGADLAIVVTPTAAGTLEATATVAGDAAQTDVVPANNTAPATTTVARAVKSQPGFSGEAPVSAPAGRAIADEAKLTGSFQATGTITFALHGPDDATCAGAPLVTSTASVSGDGTYHSEPYTPKLPGTYRWVAGYGGDVSNEPAGPTACADPAQAVVVTKATPILTTQAGPGTSSGNPIGSVTVLERGVDASGTLTTRVYAPGDTACATALATTTTTVTGDGSYRSEPFTAHATGSYRWLTSYGGDAANEALGWGTCAGAAESPVAASTGELPTIRSYGVAATLTIGSQASQAVTARCPAGSALTGGGALLEGTPGTAPALPNNGLKLNGTLPGDGGLLGDGALDPTAWTAVAAFGGQSEPGDVARAFAVCATLAPAAHMTVKVVSTSTEEAATADAGVTATCPVGTRLAGGGALGTPATAQNLRPVASFPSDALGRLALNGARDPGSWTAIASAPSVTAGAVTSAFALCSDDPALHTIVARVDASGPQTASAAATITASCPVGAPLLSGGARLDASGEAPPQGVHLRGSYPSAADGDVLGPDTSGLGSWSAVAQSGPQNALGTNQRVVALCAATPPVVAPPPPPTPDPTPPPPPPPPPAVVPPPHPPGPTTTTQIAKQLRHDIVPSAKNARISLLLGRSAIALPVKALRAGKVVVSWYRVTTGRKGKKVRTLVASGRVSVTSPRTATVGIRPTAYGKRLLERAGKAALTANGTFTPSGAVAVSASRTFVLRR